MAAAGVGLAADPGMGGGALCPAGTGGGADLGPDPDDGRGAALGPEPEIGGGACFGPDPDTTGTDLRADPESAGLLPVLADGKGAPLGAEPKAFAASPGSLGPEPPGAAGGAGLADCMNARGGGVTTVASAEAASRARPGAMPGDRFSALNSCAMMATSLGRFHSSMPSFQTWTTWPDSSAAMYLAASAQLSGPFSTPSTATNHSLRATGGRDTLDEARTSGGATGMVLDKRAEASCGPGTTSPPCSVTTSPQFLQRMRTMRCRIFSSAMV